MNRSFSVGLLSIFILFSGFSGVVNASQELEQKGLKGFFSLIKQDWQEINELNYFKADKLLIDLPNNQAFEISWGFGGSGDILTPFPALKFDLKSFDSEKVQSDEEQKNKNFWQNLVKTFLKSKAKKKIKDKLGEYTKDLPALEWLLKAKNSPVATFTLKLWLLSRYQFDGQEIRKKVEILRLLFRLAQSGVLNILDHNKSLFSYLPEEVNEVLNENISHDLRNFIDDMWTGLGKGFKQYEFDKDGSYNKDKVGIRVYGFVFNDKDFAQECFDKSVISGFISEDELVQNVKKKSDTCNEYHPDIIDIKRFLDVKDTSYKFVSDHDFGRINGDTKVSLELADYLPEEIKENVLACDDFPKVLMVENGNEFWVIYVKDKLAFWDTVKLSFVSLLKAFEEYRQIRIKGNDIVNIDQEPIKLTNEQREELENLLGKKMIRIKELELYEAKIGQQKKVVQKKEAAGVKSQFYKDSLRLAKKKLNNLIKEKENCENDLKIVNKRIRDLELKANSVLDLSSDDDKNLGKNILKLLLKVFVHSPELKGMFTAFNGKDVIYKLIKENLLKRLAYILRDSENFEDNIEIYEYIIGELFPELKKDFHSLATNELKGDQGFFDNALTVLGLG